MWISKTLKIQKKSKIDLEFRKSKNYEKKTCHVFGQL
jgi:hypothetical protein